MEFKVQKLDRRHAGHEVFTHYVAPKNYYLLLEKINFLEVRKWCWDTFGPGVERDWADEFHGRLQNESTQNYAWAWHTEQGSKRIYLTAEAYTIFALTWL